MKLAGILNGPDSLSDRLAALDRAIALEPLNVEPYDQKALVLAEAGRYDEAMAACTAEAWCERRPVTLRGRAAWVAARRGDARGAIPQTRDALAQDTDYYWGWQNLADWTCDAGETALYLEAAEAMVRLVPDNVQRRIIGATPGRRPATATARRMNSAQRSRSRHSAAGLRSSYLTLSSRTETSRQPAKCSRH